MSVVRPAAVLIAACSVLGGTIVTAHAAEAGAPPAADAAHCAGVLTGDLQDVRVAPGASCHVHAATVGGTISVPASSSIAIDDSVVTGAITGEGSGSFIAVKNSQTGDISLARTTSGPNTGGVFLEHADVGRLDVNGYSYDPQAVVDQSVVRGDLVVNGPMPTFNGITVGGDLTVQSGYYPRQVSIVRFANVTGNAKLDAPLLRICGGEFAQNVTVKGNTPAFGANGPECGGNVVQGNLTYNSQFTAKFALRSRVAGNTVHGQASGTVENPNYNPIMGGGNQFLGGVSGALATIKDAEPYDVPAPDLSASQRRAQEIRDAASR